MTATHATEAYYRATIASLEAQVKRVRELHGPVEYQKRSATFTGSIGTAQACAHCLVRYPCPTIRALDGERDE